MKTSSDPVGEGTSYSALQDWNTGADKEAGMFDWFDRGNPIYDFLQAPYDERMAREAATRTEQRIADQQAAAEADTRVADQDMYGRGIGYFVDPESGFVQDTATGAYYAPDRLPTNGGVAPANYGGLTEVVAETAAPVTTAEAVVTGTDITNGTDPWAGLTDASPAVATEEVGIEAAVEPKKETLWDNIVSGAGSVLEHTALGSVVKSLFPDFWYGTGESIKSVDDGTGRASSGTSGIASSIVGGSDASTGSNTAAAVAETVFTDLNKNGIDDLLEGYVAPAATATTTAGTQRKVVFPDKSYRPGYDDEWVYFRDQFARGGMVLGYAEGGGISPLAGADPRVTVIADAEDALTGESDDPEAAIRKFVAMFGEDALKRLRDSVKAGSKMRNRSKGGRMIEGPGGPTDDAVPAMIDGNQPAALSDGEYVFSADAVKGAGGGDREAGAAALQELHDRLAGMKAA